MKKTIIAALVFAASAVCYTAQAAGKKDKVKDVPPTVEFSTPVALDNTVDSVSYAAGWSQAANGLLPFLQQQLNVDVDYMADFVRGFEDAVKKGDDKAYTAYAAGIQIAQMAQQRILPSVSSEFEGADGINNDMFYRGFIGYLLKDSSFMNDSLANAYYREHAEAAHQTRIARMREGGEKFLAENKTKEGVQVTASGLQYKVITEGTGEKPTVSDRVKVKYTGRTIDGNIFDASERHDKEGVELSVGGVISGWTEALLLMPVGSKYQLFIPYNLAYGERGAGRDIPPYAALIFDIELVSIVK